MFGCLRKAFAHPDIGICDRDDPADGFHVAVVRPCLVDRPGEVAQEGADEAISLPNRERRVGGHSRVDHIPGTRGIDGPVGEGLLECAAVIGRLELAPEAERVGGQGLEDVPHRRRQVA